MSNDPIAIVRPSNYFTTQKYVQIEERVGQGERLGLEARHEFGRELLVEREAHGGKQLPNGRAEEVAKAAGISEAELRKRVQAAELFPEVSKFLQTFRTWDSFVNRGSDAHVTHNSGDNEWYTPPDYIAAAREVMGGIDLDPASTSEANDVIGASVFFTEVDGALTRPWEGRVWMNPPYARPLVDQFCAKLAEDYASGGVSQACVLVNNATETGWFHALAEVASAFCFPRHRVKFWHPRKEATPLQGQAVVYMGESVQPFRHVFVRFGFTVTS